MHIPTCVFKPLSLTTEGCTERGKHPKDAGVRAVRKNSGAKCLTCSRGYLKILNLTPKSPLHVVERGLETPLFSPSLRSGEGVGGEVKRDISNFQISSN
jgi:hypothetical protein